jgi:carbonic anhydrase
MLEKEDARLFSDTVAYTNVENSLEEIISGSDIIIDLFSKGEIGIVGAVYNVGNGKVDFFKNLTPKDK